MTVLNLGIVGAGWFAAGLVWWWVLSRAGFRFEAREGKPRREGLEISLQDRAERLDRAIARRRAKHAAFN